MVGKIDGGVHDDTESALAHLAKAMSESWASNDQINSVQLAKRLGPGQHRMAFLKEGSIEMLTVNVEADSESKHKPKRKLGRFAGKLDLTPEEAFAPLDEQELTSWEAGSPEEVQPLSEALSPCGGGLGGGLPLRL